MLIWLAIAAKITILILLTIGSKHCIFARWWRRNYPGKRSQFECFNMVVGKCVKNLYNAQHDKVICICNYYLQDYHLARQFGRSLYLPICLSSKMDALSVVSLGLIVPLMMFLMVILFIFL